jgi:hypothetical protein
MADSESIGFRTSRDGHNLHIVLFYPFSYIELIQINIFIEFVYRLEFSTYRMETFSLSLLENIHWQREGTTHTSFTGGRPGKIQR